MSDVEEQLRARASRGMLDEETVRLAMLVIDDLKSQVQGLTAEVVMLRASKIEESIRPDYTDSTRETSRRYSVGTRVGETC